MPPFETSESLRGWGLDYRDETAHADAVLAAERGLPDVWDDRDPSDFETTFDEMARRWGHL